MEGSTAVKSFRGIYELDTIEDVHKSLQRKKWNSLTLVKLDKIDSNEISVETKENDDDRPLTPINEAVLSAPKTYSQLTRFIQQRIKPRSSWSHISIHDQYSVGEVLLAEVNAIWCEFRKQIDDPFLTTQQNKELRRRIAVYIVTVCEQLFMYFCDHVKVLNSKDVFSKDANMSRICGQVATTAGTCFNLLKVRRLVIEDLRQDDDSDILKIFRRLNPIFPTKFKLSLQNTRNLSNRGFIRTPKSRRNASKFNLSQELQDLRKQMPALNFSQMTAILEQHAQSKRIVDEIDKSVDEESVSPRDEKSFTVQRKVKKWNSDPMLSFHTLTNKEMIRGDEDSPAFFPQPQHSDSNIADRLVQNQFKKDSTRSSSFSKAIELNVLSTIPIESSETLNDLENLMKMQSKSDRNVDEESEEGIPSLIRVITRYQSQNANMKKLKSEELFLTAQENKWDAEERKPLPSPKYPQPPFHQTKVPGCVNLLSRTDVTIRTSDVHVPHNVDLPTLTLQINQPLYNDLTGDLSPGTVKSLDSNLFQDQDLKEVYSEIMKTVSDDHLLFDNDNAIIKPIRASNVKKMLASTTLTNPPSMRLINPDLKVQNLSSHRNAQPQSFLELLDKPTSTKSEGKISVASSRLVAEAPAKAIADQASWMAWWKATINTDDYFKYLSTKETDFLGVIYHFYNSETSGSELDAEEKRKLMEDKRKIELFIEEVKKKKEEFAPGLWNVNVVRLGGLGNYPVFKDKTVNEFLEHLSSEEATEFLSLLSGSKNVATSYTSIKDSASSSGNETEVISFKSRTQLSEGEATPCPRCGKSTSTDRMEATDSEMEAENSSLLLLNCNKIILSSLKRKKSSDEFTSSGYESYDNISSSVFHTEVRKQQLYYIDSNRLKKRKRNDQKKAIDQESEFDAVSGVPSITETAQSLPSTEFQVTKSMQARFEVVWQKLRMSAAQKLSAAAKYSSDQFIDLLEEIISSWERITELIEKREKLLSELEIFELDASDPQRHFRKGSKGSSTNRLKEATVRAKFYRQLEKVEVSISPLLHSLYAEYSDIVTLAGRPYHEKMNCDKVEMLYWLQQERRAVQLNKVGEPEQLKQFMRDNHVTTGENFATNSSLPLSVSTVKINHEA